ncbi:hypothetical protein IAR50_005961 [Cryptococcus sp. DSM 104548]
MTSKSAAYFDAVIARRSFYKITKRTTLSQDELKDILDKAILHAPSAFNGQQSRAVLVTGDVHDELWDLVKGLFLKTLVGDEAKQAFWNNKFDTTYKPGYGTVIFLEDQVIINDLAAKYPPYARAFHGWSESTTGIVQHIVWTALVAEGHGATLQHFPQVSSEIEAEVIKFVDVPTTWKVAALMPFGVPAEPAAEKSFEPLEGRTKYIFGKE